MYDFDVHLKFKVRFNPMIKVKELRILLVIKDLGGTRFTASNILTKALARLKFKEMRSFIGVTRLGG